MFESLIERWRTNDSSHEPIVISNKHEPKRCQYTDRQQKSSTLKLSHSEDELVKCCFELLMLMCICSVGSTQAATQHRFMQCRGIHQNRGNALSPHYKNCGADSPHGVGHGYIPRALKA